MAARMRERYEDEVKPLLMREFDYRNTLQVPSLHKIVINVGVGEGNQNQKALDATVRDVAAITGQHPVVTKARKSIAAFKLREGFSVGVMVTLRSSRMYEFFDRLVNVALPRSRDFQGISTNSFDGRGNYTLGLRDQLIFPEIDYDKIDKLRGMEVSVVTTARTDEEGQRLLQLLGMPFKRS
ncbi:MAG: 50S ribosomal protein L5 [Chloroflexi bacterium]|nr:50S ribosomal protein L5 [Chloroflexota bacterium]